jgi:hypothetical protein
MIYLIDVIAEKDGLKKTEPQSPDNRCRKPNHLTI